MDKRLTGPTFTTRTPGHVEDVWGRLIDLAMSMIRLRTTDIDIQKIHLMSLRQSGIRRIPNDMLRDVTNNFSVSVANAIWQRGVFVENVIDW